LRVAPARWADPLVVSATGWPVSEGAWLTAIPDAGVTAGAGAPVEEGDEVEPPPPSCA